MAVIREHRPRWAMHHVEGSNMLNWGVITDSTDTDRPVRRVRDEVKDGVGVIVASAFVSISIAVLVLLIMKLAG
ncbi:MAG: hypothetical protein ACR2KG_00455 [Nocardioidaceae bacterium]